jgi:hypothetical protein
MNNFPARTQIDRAPALRFNERTATTAPAEPAAAEKAPQVAEKQAN